MREVTAEDLVKVLDLHAKWLKNEEGGSRANLTGADLTGAYLGCADLGGANLGGGPMDGVKGFPEESIDLLRKVCESALQPEALNMGSWHTCETTHCLAGWAVHHSGSAGYALERVTSPSVAGALLIPSASHMFYASADEAREWCRQKLQEINADQSNPSRFESCPDSAL